MIIAMSSCTCNCHTESRKLATTSSGHQPTFYRFICWIYTCSLCGYSCWGVHTHLETDFSGLFYFRNINLGVSSVLLILFQPYYLTDWVIIYIMYFTTPYAQNCVLLLCLPHWYCSSLFYQFVYEVYTLIVTQRSVGWLGKVYEMMCFVTVL